MTPAEQAERALLRRLVAWPTGSTASEDSLQAIVADARALLAQPAPEGESDAWVKFLDECHDWTPKIDGLDTLTPERAVHITIDVLRAAYLKEHPRPTPRSRAEPEGQHWQSDLTVDQHLLCDSNRAGKVTIDPTLLSPATPRSRAEAEEMVEIIRDLTEHEDPCSYDHHGYCQAHGWLDASPCPYKRAAALLAALTGEGK